jgi:hypothetical protein
MFVLMRLESPMAAPARLADLQVLDGPPAEIPEGYLLFEVEPRDGFCHGHSAPVPVRLEDLAWAKVFSGKYDDYRDGREIRLPYQVIICSRCEKVLDECSEDGYEQRWHVLDVSRSSAHLESWGTEGEGTGARYTYHKCEHGTPESPGDKWRKAWWSRVDVDFDEGLF